MSHLLDRKRLLTVLAWSIFLTLIMSTVREYHRGDLPPLWDSLTYQNEALRVFRGFLESQWAVVRDFFGNELPVGFVLSHSLGLFFGGLSPSSPYLVSAFFAGLWIWGSALLSEELGASRNLAVLSAVFASVFPNFLYRNYLQTYTDYPVTAVTLITWVIFLRALKGKPRLFFVSGLIGGLAASIKIIAPTFIVWGFIVFLVCPMIANLQMKFKQRAKAVLLFSLGFLSTWVWWVVPGIRSILYYNYSWGHMPKWQASQYQLQNSLDWFLFYPRNLVRYHLSPIGFWMIAALVLFGMTKLVIEKGVWQKRRPKAGTKVERTKIDGTKIDWKEPKVLLTIYASLFSLVFMTLNRNIAAPADTCAWSLFLSVLVVFLENSIVRRKLKEQAFIGGVLVAGVVALFTQSQIQIQEPKIKAQSMTQFSDQLRHFIDSFELGQTPILAVYSHPYFNQESAAWQWLMNRKYPLDSIPLPVRNLVVTEDPSIMVDNFKDRPILLWMKKDPLTIPVADRFTNYNRLHQSIQEGLEKTGLFRVVGRFEVDGIPFEFAMHRNFRIAKVSQPTLDGWSLWGDSIKIFMASRGRIEISGIPIAESTEISLASGQKSIRLSRTQVLPDGRYVFSSPELDMSSIPQSFNLMGLRTPVSTGDLRPLAFRHIKVDIKYSGDQK